MPNCMSLVSKISTIINLSPEGAEWLSKNSKEFSFEKNETVISAGKTCNYLYYIDTGTLYSYYIEEDKEVCSWMALQGDFATAYYSFIARKPSYETIVCAEKSSVQGISYEKMNEMYQLFPESERAGRLILEEYYSRLEEHAIEMRSKSAKERYQMLFKRRPEIIRQLPLGRIASYLGMSQETLSRIRAEK